MSDLPDKRKCPTTESDGIHPAEKLALVARTMVAELAPTAAIAEIAAGPGDVEQYIGQGYVDVEVQIESEQRLMVSVSEEIMSQNWENYFLDVYDPSRIARVRIKNGEPRYSNKFALLPPEMGRVKSSLRIEMKPLANEARLALWRIALQFMDMPGSSIYEKYGKKITLKDGSSAWLNSNGHQSWIEVDGTRSIEELLPDGITFLAYEKSSISLISKCIYKEESFHKAFLNNIDNTSRSAKGVFDTTVAAEKSELIDPAAAKELIVQENMSRVANYIWSQRQREVSCPEMVMEVIWELAKLTNDGLTQSPTALRTWAVKYNDVAAEDVVSALQGFSKELFLMYKQVEQGKISPLEMASWIEWQFDHEIHPLVDGCGRVSKSLSSLFLLICNHVLPKYEDRESYYQAMNTGRDEFNAYYLQSLRLGVTQLNSR